MIYHSLHSLQLLKLILVRPPGQEDADPYWFFVEEQLQEDDAQKEDVFQAEDCGHGGRWVIFVGFEPWQYLVHLVGGVAANDYVWEDCQEAE